MNQAIEKLEKSKELFESINMAAMNLNDDYVSIKNTVISFSSGVSSQILKNPSTYISVSSIKSMTDAEVKSLIRRSSYFGISAFLIIMFVCLISNIF